MSELTLLILNGPGLSEQLEGEEAPAICAELCNELGVALDFRAPGDVSSVCRAIESEAENFDALLINPFHSSEASLSSVESYETSLQKIADTNIPIAEIHMSNIFAGDGNSIRPIQGPAGRMGLVSGMGAQGYLLAIRALARK